MPHPVYVPRVNNNDDEVRLIAVHIAVGQEVRPGETLAVVETDKASIDVEADRSGFVLRVMPGLEELVRVGSVLIWLGDRPNDAVPGDEELANDSARSSVAAPTAKARELLARHGLDPAAVPASGERLRVADVEAFLATTAKPASTSTHPTVHLRQTASPMAAGALEPLDMDARGMMRSVLWHRDEAVPAYLEISYSATAWHEYARQFAEQHRLLGDPLLALMGHRLVHIAGGHKRMNSTIVDGQRYAYQHVNLGFTIQVGQTLYLVVVPEAEGCDEAQMVAALNRLHRRAVAGKLEPADLSGATVAFSSMARWEVCRHVPVLPQHVSLIVAHVGAKDGRAVLGASYDHRVLSGGDTAGILEQLALPPEGA